MHTLTTLVETAGNLSVEKLVWIVVLAAFGLAAFTIHNVTLIVLNRMRAPISNCCSPHFVARGEVGLPSNR